MNFQRWIRKPWLRERTLKKTVEIIGRYTEKIAATVNKAAESVARDGIAGTFDLENALHDDAAALCRDLMAFVFSIDGAEVPGNTLRQGEYDAGKRAKTIKTLFGDIRCEGRNYYYNQKKKTGRYPFDDALGLVKGKYSRSRC